MTNTSRTTPLRRRLAGVAGSAVALALTVAVAPTGPATARPQKQPTHAQSAAARTVDVMARNLYLGADLMPVITALAQSSAPGDDPWAVPKAATATWAAVQATKPDERMAAVAEEIAKSRPAVVGLQEVTTWTTWDYDMAAGASNPKVQYDFLDLLLDALADHGVVYKEVAGATAQNFTAPPIPILTASGGMAAVSMADRDVILRRADVKATNAHTGQFTNIISFPMAGAQLPVKRGWGSVDVQAKKAKFRFVNSHLEAFGIPGVDAEALRVKQVGELLAAQADIRKESGRLPMVYVGDYNSDAPSAPAYKRLVKAVGTDAWVARHRRAPGYTCCFDAEVKDPNDKLDSRIDLIVTNKTVQAKRTTIVGEELGDRTASGLWPSDHAGVVSRLLVWPAHALEHRHGKSRK